jgi:mRNA interferase MazF
VIIRRGDVFLARLNNERTEGLDEIPVIVMSRDSLNQNCPVIVVVPVVEKIGKTRIYPSRVPIRAGDGGITVDSIALGEQVRAIDASRLGKQLGHLTVHTIAEISVVLRIVLDI